MTHPRDHGAGQLQGRYWPTTTVELDPPRIPDGRVDVRALCARWDRDANQVAG